MATVDKSSILDEVGQYVDDAAEETFILFSQDLPQNDLGMVDDKLSEVEIDINGHEYSILQSSSLLRSNRSAGTTGAMVWKVSPLVAQWLSSKDNFVWEKGLLNSSDNVMELGCGVAGIIAMALSPMVLSYVLTDQSYVLKLLKENIHRNQRLSKANTRMAHGKHSAAKRSFENVQVLALDWEHDSVQNLKDLSSSQAGVDVLIVCDCVFNTFLIEPLTMTCIEICQMDRQRSTLIIIAQQLRANDIFEEWLTRFLKDFRMWRLNDEMLSPKLDSRSGYVVHMALLRSNDHS